jgi:hypothetical protein
MASTDAVSRLTPYIEQLLEDESARDNLRQGADKLRGAYHRSQKKRVKAAKDKRLRRQLQSAAQSLAEGATALAHDTQKPKKHRGRKLFALLTVAAIGAGVAIALNEDLRSSLLGSSSDTEQSTDGAGS